MLPCRTPQLRVRADDSLPLILHLWVRPLKYDENHFIAASSTPKYDILLKMISLLMVSNALVRSIKTRPLSMFTDQAFVASFYVSSANILGTVPLRELGRSLM